MLRCCLYLGREYGTFPSGNYCTEEYQCSNHTNSAIYYVNSPCLGGTLRVILYSSLKEDMCHRVLKNGVVMGVVVSGCTSSNLVTRTFDLPNQSRPSCLSESMTRDYPRRQPPHKRRQVV